MKLLFKQAQIVDVNSPYHLQTVDVLVDGDVILTIEPTIVDSEAAIVELNGSKLFTAFAELHSDLGEPGNEECETLVSGAAAAAAGGFSAVGVVSNGSPWIENKTGVEYILSKSEGTAIHLIPIGTMSKGHQGEELSEMFEMNEHGAPFFGDYKKGVQNANLLKLALLYTKPFSRIMVHPEDQNLSAGGKMHEGAMSTYVGLKGIPSIAEEVQVKRDLQVLEYTEGTMHMASISTKESVEAIRAAKAKGLNITCSVNAHHLLFTDAALEHYDTEFKVSPPLRSKEDQVALWQGVLDGTVDCIAIDHLPKDIEQKQCEFDNASFGMAGLEGALCNLLDTYQPDLDLIQRVFSTNPRVLLGLPELRIAEGEVAEFTIIGTKGQHWTGFASKAFNNPFTGTQTVHSVDGVYVKGQLLAL